MPIAALNLHVVDLWKEYIPLALNIAQRYEAYRATSPQSAFVLGINAPPGSGKSTLVQVLCFLLELAAEGRERPTIVQFSSDDCYNTKAPSLPGLDPSPYIESTHPTRRRPERQRGCHHGSMRTMSIRAAPRFFGT